MAYSMAWWVAYKTIVLDRFIRSYISRQQKYSLLFASVQLFVLIIFFSTFTMGFYYTTCVSLASFVVALAFPRETSVSGQLNLPHATTSASPPAVTEDANLRCMDESTILYTTDCTIGTPVSYCWKPEPPIKCRAGYFPSVWHPDHCMEEQTCFPLNAAWITTECSNGAIPYSTTTLYDGTLAGGKSTAIICKQRNFSRNPHQLT